MGVSACHVVVTANDVKAAKIREFRSIRRPLSPKLHLTTRRSPHPEHEFVAKWKSFSLGSSMSGAGSYIATAYSRATRVAPRKSSRTCTACDGRGSRSAETVSTPVEALPMGHLITT
jgi:hypothetical protein